MGVRTGLFKGAGGVYLAIGAGERGNEYPGPRHLVLADENGALFIERHILHCRALAAVCGEHALQLAAPGGDQFVRGQHIAVQNKDAVAVDGAQGGGIGCQAVGQDAILGDFYHKAALIGCKQGGSVQPLGKGKAQFAAEGHLAHGGSGAALFYHSGRENGLVLHAGANRLHQGHSVFVIRQTGGLIYRNLQQIHFAARVLQQGGAGVRRLAHTHGEAHQGRRYIQFVKGAAHRVFTANGGGAVPGLCGQGAQQGGSGLAPALRLVAQALKIFLEGEPCFCRVAAHGSQFRKALRYCKGGGMEGAPARYAGDKAVGHHRSVVRLAVLQGQLGYHGLLRGQLVHAGVRHIYRGGADGGIEPLHQSLLGADFQSAQIGFQRSGQRQPLQLCRYGM